MALFRIDHVPQSVDINLPLNIILPDPGNIGEVPVAQRKVLYLLHGLSDDASAWERYTSIERVATDYGIVVVMPSAGRSFYTDQPTGQKYYTYLTEELPRYLKEVFGLAPRREDTYIAGNSMGGYGAFKAALQRPELYAAAASFSGMLSLEILRLLPDDPRKAEFTYLFGDLEKLAGSEYDPVTWLKRAAQNPSALPRLYITTGRQEDIYLLSKLFYAACESLGVAADYYEEDNTHNWYFWDAMVKRFLREELRQA